MNVFEMTQKTLFKHCDPAGIVFYPRYFEMMNDCVEAFFDTALDHPFEDLHQTASIPTAQIETRFAAPSRHGDVLRFKLVIKKLGRASARYGMTGHCEDELRFETLETLVHDSRDGRPTPWPVALRARLSSFEEMAS